MTSCQSDVITLSLTDSLLFLVDLFVGYWKDLREVFPSSIISPKSALNKSLRLYETSMCDNISKDHCC